MTEPVRTERLVIRPYTADDLDDFADIQRRPDVVEYMFWPIRDRAASKRHLADRRRKTRLEQGHDFLGLAVELPDEPSLNVRPGSGRVIGDVSLLLRNVPARQLEVGWVMNPDFAGRGYATEASRAMLDLAFRRAGAHRVVAQLDARNTASARMAERLGMRREGHFREELRVKGEWVDSLYYAVLADEWAATPPGA
ncbi:GNAT family N-acetyltransferase [Clavibacter zhangzhiyongii]|uniref:GNAT family N-acetyltransferase n=1 Tax=Clavibacter zhangzhiyongii TaxID=2768071 RepID=A0A7L7Z3G1_9MICO|nr:GNAT family protein [Clavibacter zhangzhiyongii]QOD44252.1 GNAT family N-acetyltransferase [Clavibacter zhangzhiyongii]